MYFFILIMYYVCIFIYIYIYIRSLSPSFLVLRSYEVSAHMGHCRRLRRGRRGQTLWHVTQVANSETATTATSCSKCTDISTGIPSETLSALHLWRLRSWISRIRQTTTTQICARHSFLTRWVSSVQSLGVHL